MLRFVITHVNHGLRTLTLPCQGRHTFATRPDAERALAQLCGPEGLCRILDNEEMASLEVREVECWDHGDPKCTVFA